MRCTSISPTPSRFLPRIPKVTHTHRDATNRLCRPFVGVMVVRLTTGADGKGNNPNMGEWRLPVGPKAFQPRKVGSKPSLSFSAQRTAKTAAPWHSSGISLGDWFRQFGSSRFSFAFCVVTNRTIRKAPIQLSVCTTLGWGFPNGHGHGHCLAAWH